MVATDSVSLSVRRSIPSASSRAAHSGGRFDKFEVFLAPTNRSKWIASIAWSVLPTRTSCAAEPMCSLASEGGATVSSASK